MYMISVASKNNYLKWIMTVGIVLTMYSVSYFYYLLPGSDSVYFRGMHEYFNETKSLDFSVPGKEYFQWPSIFILTNIATSISGLELANLEFIIYTLLGFLLATTLYIYASKVHRNGGFITVIVYFLAMRYYLNYQFVPFTMALVLLFLLFILDTKRKSPGVVLTMFVLFVTMTITHLFTPLFFVIYLLLRYIINRSKQYVQFFLLTLTTWIMFQITYAYISFDGSIWILINRSTEVSLLDLATANPVSVPIDAISQSISTAILVISILICVIGSIVMLIRRKIRGSDWAIFITAVGYFSLGIVIYVLGSRAIPLAFIPVSLGAAYIFESRFRKYLVSLVLILLILFSFIPLHSAFSKNDIMFQTKEAYMAENFFVENYNWADRSIVFANFRVVTYFASKLIDNPLLRWKYQTLNETDTIFYTIGLGLYLSQYNDTLVRILHEETSNLVYTNGFSMIITKVGP